LNPQPTVPPLPQKTVQKRLQLSWRATDGHMPQAPASTRHIESEVQKQPHPASLGFVVVVVLDVVVVLVVVVLVVVVLVDVVVVVAPVPMSSRAAWTQLSMSVSKSAQLLWPAEQSPWVSAFAHLSSNFVSHLA
jgi:hypothetical protein